MALWSRAPFVELSPPPAISLSLLSLLARCTHALGFRWAQRSRRGRARCSEEMREREKSAAGDGVWPMTRAPIYWLQAQPAPSPLVAIHAGSIDSASWLVGASCFF
jgi:protein-S-isoprenylcysteine O-methyltransferase Ste14